jgi:hypothetical protein
MISPAAARCASLPESSASLGVGGSPSGVAAAAARKNGARGGGGVGGVGGVGGPAGGSSVADEAARIGDCRMGDGGSARAVCTAGGGKAGGGTARGGTAGEHRGGDASVAENPPGGGGGGLAAAVSLRSAVITAGASCGRSKGGMALGWSMEASSLCMRSCRLWCSLWTVRRRACTARHVYHVRKQRASTRER